MKENTGAVHAQVPVDVATYLLNEKRVELHSVEARMKVNIVLIPNIHLETPNYTVTRFKHEELNQSEPTPPSYEMVTAPEQTQTPLPVPGHEAPTPRQEAVVKSITPSQPAPVAEPKPVEAKPEPSIIGKILHWFRSPQPAASAAPQAEPARATSEPGQFSRSRQGMPPRRDRDRDRDRQRGQQRERGGRGESPAEGAMSRHEQRGRPHDRSQGREQQPRRDHQQQPPQQRPAQNAPAAPGPTSAAPDRAQEQGQRHEGRRRRRRGGRERFEQHGQGPAESRPGAPTPQPNEHVAAREEAVVSVALESLASAPATVESPPKLAFEHAEIRQAPLEPVHREEVAAVSAAEPAERAIESVVSVPQTPPPAPPAIAPMAFSSDLVQIETDPQKVRIPATTVEPPAPPRPPRVRPAPPPVSDEPLVQIETRK